MILLKNLIMYLRKSRSDDISMSVEDVLAKHEGIIQEYCEREFGTQLPENRIFREVVSGEGYCRVSYAYSVEHLTEAMKRIREFLKENGINSGEQ